MALLEVLIETLSSNPLTALLAITTAVFLSRCLYRLTLHPLSHIPGPLLPKLTSLWLYYHAYIGDEATVIHKAHKQYGPYIRVSPHEVDISDADALGPIYISKGGFMKADIYNNFDIDGHKTIFSTTDVDFRTPRAKAVVPMFSTKNIRGNEVELYGCVDRVIQRMEDEAVTGKPVNVLNLGRSLAVDVVSTHLFQQNYDGTSEKGNRLSVSAFVDAFVAVGRFFYLPNTVFVWLEWAIEKFVPDQHTNDSMAVVHHFVENLVSTTPKGAQNYPGRLMALDLETSEVISQCKDLIFAGTDSTGMNFATICRLLALNPDKYDVLHAEILANANAGPAKKEIQELPYLTGVVKEGLRLSMANPTRLPHVVPEGGWVFKGTYFPAGSVVGCSARELHFNPVAYPRPHSFQPERWLEGNVTPEANKHFYAFGVGSRSCIARNLATIELFMATERIVEADVLRGARACQDKVVIYEWFNSSVKGESIDLIWENKTSA
ncbi:Cytochrome P450 monooxygenase yanH [Hyphodiscus hymeniophilus]|uniref:Cytochrome P450 monooxygenase yanH n=1 Tax=Hyphodiscus hymeniophilus TaxID=353542 RepID=A0A9P7AUB7_9HELO|nr:Cytochrome P450 monooxygenase yanH [Hyphodiscus hymeniophilus]